MPKFNMSYAFDVPHYFDFSVEADTEAQAEKLAEEALAAGVFDDGDDCPASKVTACWDNSTASRVFSSGLERELDNHQPELVREDGKLKLQEAS